MFSEFKERITNRLKAKREAKPLVSNREDLELVKRVKGRRFPEMKQLGHIAKILSPNEKRIILLSFLVLIMGVGLFGFDLFRKNTQEVPAVGGTYTEAVVGSPQLVNPIFASINDVDTDLSKLIFSGLMKYDKNKELVTDLAESYEVSEDKKTYTFKLKKNVVWHDGSEFTAKDVLFTFQTIQDQSVGSPLYVTFQGVDVKMVDDYTVTFTLKELFTPFLSSLTVGIISENAWFDVSPDRIRLHKQNLQPVGTGPFMFKKITKDQSGYIRTYELERFKGYYEKPAYIESLVFKFFPEYDGVDGAIQALRSQRVDGLNFVPHDLLDKVERKYITLHTLQLPQYTALFFNLQSTEILKKPKVRTALEYALDKDRILREALKGEGRVIYSPILPGSPGYNPEITKTEYSVEKANEQLDQDWPRIPAEEYRAKRKEALLKEWEASQPKEEENISAPIEGENIASSTENMEISTTTVRELAEKEIDDKLNTELNPAQVFYRKNGDDGVLELKLVTTDNQEYRKSAEFIAGFWQEIGVKVDIEYISTKDFSRNVLKGKKYDVLLYSVILGADPEQFPFWHSSQVDFPGLNLSSYVNRNVDALLEKARETDNIDELNGLYAKFQEIILNERPAVFLYMQTYTYATSENVKGIDVVRISHPSDRFVNITEWYIKTKTGWKE